MHGSSFLGQYLRNPFGNASGTFSCDSAHALKQLDNHGYGILFTKSICENKKKHNDFNNFSVPATQLFLRNMNADLNGENMVCFINSMGLPGPGSDYWFNKLDDYEFNSPVIASVATGTGDLNEYQKVVKKLESKVKGYEINVSCPNTGKKIIGYNKESLEEVVSKVVNATSLPFSVKLPCYYKKESMKEVHASFDSVSKVFIEDFTRIIKKNGYKTNDLLIDNKLNDAAETICDYYKSVWIPELIDKKRIKSLLKVIPKKHFTFQIPTEIDADLLSNVLNLLKKHGVSAVTSHNTIPAKHPLLGPPQGGLSGRLINDIALKQACFINDNFPEFDIAFSGGVYPDMINKILSIPSVKVVQIGSYFFDSENSEKSLNGISDSRI